MKNDNFEITQRKNNEGFGLFDPLFNEFFDFPVPRHEFKEMERIMKTDIKESETGYDLEIEMPGFNKNDINMDLNDGYLTISASRKENVDEKDKKGNYIRRERHYGNYQRSFYVGKIKEDDIKAKLDNGILSINVPKEQQLPNKKHITIE